MNEHLKSLYDQATVTEVVEDNWRTNNSYKVQKLDPNLFAELIIKECCDVFVELRTRPADLAVKDVKQHFGLTID